VKAADDNDFCIQRSIVTLRTVSWKWLHIYGCTCQPV